MQGKKCPDQEIEIRNNLYSQNRKKYSPFKWLPFYFKNIANIQTGKMFTPLHGWRNIQSFLQRKAARRGPSGPPVEVLNPFLKKGCCIYSCLELDPRLPNLKNGQVKVWKLLKSYRHHVVSGQEYKISISIRWKWFFVFYDMLGATVCPIFKCLVFNSLLFEKEIYNQEIKYL